MMHDCKMHEDANVPGRKKSTEIGLKTCKDADVRRRKKAWKWAGKHAKM